MMLLDLLVNCRHVYHPCQVISVFLIFWWICVCVCVCVCVCLCLGHRCGSKKQELLSVEDMNKEGINETGKTGWWVKWVPCKPRIWARIPRTYVKMWGMVSHFYNACTGEMETWESLGLSTAGQSGLGGKSTLVKGMHSSWVTWNCQIVFWPLQICTVAFFFFFFFILFFFFFLCCWGLKSNVRRWPLARRTQVQVSIGCHHLL